MTGNLRSNYGFVLSGAILAGLSTFVYFAEQLHADTNAKLKVSTFSGAYKISQEKAFFTPFTEKTGTPIEVTTHKQPLVLLKKWKENVGTSPDVIDLSAYHAEKACDAGYIMPLREEDIAVGANNEPIAKDFLGNSLIDCAIPTVAWSALMVVKNGKFEKKKPRTWSDFFNVKRFPGKRSLKKSARYTLEMALMADKVQPNDIYFTLQTIEGQKRAFAQLDELKDDIVWWENSKDAISNLELDETVMGLAFNGRLFNAIIGEGLDLNLVWQGQIYDLDYLAIPAKSQQQQKAINFINFATSPQQLAEQSKWMPYGPMRSSSLQYVSNHEIADIHMAPYLPTTKAHFVRALKFNESWWLSDEGKKLEEKFAQWLAGELNWPEAQSKESD